MKKDIKDILGEAIQVYASDVHFVVGRPPVFRVQGNLKSSGLAVLEQADLQNMVDQILTPEQREIFARERELDFSFQAIKGYYFRINLYREKGFLAVTVRIMPGIMKTLSELGLPPVVSELTRRRAGLILIVGRAGSGKTTTLTHMIDLINSEREAKIVMIEDPIELVHASKKSVIVQREVGVDTHSFASGLKYALRQDPDVVVVGEMRDPESISMALTTAETGHLVLATLHAPDAIEAINRIIDVYPGEKQDQIRVQLAESLAAIIGQQLVPANDGAAQALVTEIIIANMPVRNLIRRHSLSEIRGQMETGRDGMHTLEQCLSDMSRRGIIASQVAQNYAKYPELLDMGR